MKKIDRRSFLKVMGVAVGAAALSACGSASSAASAASAGSTASASSASSASSAAQTASGSVVWWTWSTEATDAYQQIVALFNQKYPNVKVDLQFISNSDYWTKLPVAIAGGTGPDIFQMTRPSFELYAASNQAADLTSAVSGSADLTANLAAMDPKLVSTYQFNGAQMAIPYTVETTAIAYNKDLFKAAGIADPKDAEASWTWDDLREMAKKLTVKSASGETEQYGFLIPADRMLTWEKIWSHGAEMFNDAKDACQIADSSVIEALQPLVDMYAKDGVSPTTDATATMSADDMFMTGKIAMLAAGIWKVPTYRGITGFEWDVVELPFDPDTGKRVSSSNVLGFVVNPGSKAMDNAVRFLEVASSPDAQRILAESGTYIPANTSERDPYFETTEASPANLLAYQRALDYVHPNTLTQYIPYSQFLEEYTNGLRDAYNGAKTLEQAMKDSQDSINKIMDDNKKTFGVS